ncbi:MAG: thiamine pyrophosphate-dependent dehydrogenase E1 component subunit alpha [Alphaproteobacteria bacterium]
MTDRRNIDIPRLTAHYRTMARIRAFEEAAEQASKDGLVTGAVHLSIGQEGIASGVCANLTADDQITTTHRGHGHCIAKGTDPGAMMLELFGREGGTCGGKGGSMHIADFKVGMLGANGVVAAGIPIAVGAAHGAKLQGSNRVVVCFFGDGAINRGPFLEGLNWATIFRLPVLFVCESNGFASTTRTDAVTGGPGPVARAEALGVRAQEVDGNDVLAVDEAVAACVERMRAGGGPEFLLARTYRLKGHTASDPAPYRPADEVEARWAEDPKAAVARTLADAGVDVAAIDAEAKAEIDGAVATANAAGFPAPERAYDDIQDIGAPAWAS